MKAHEPQQTGRAYDAITHLWTRADFNQDNGIAQHQRALAFAQESGFALDVGCGCNGRLTRLLLAQGYRVDGVDISTEMIRLAQQRQPQAHYFHADICQWPLPRRYDFVTAWDSLWHVPLAQQAALITRLLNSLASGGVFIFSCGGLDKAAEHTDNAMGPEVYYASLGINGYLRVIEQAGCVIRHLEFDQYPELHLYMIVQKP